MKSFSKVLKSGAQGFKGLKGQAPPLHLKGGATLREQAQLPLF